MKELFFIYESSQYFGLGFTKIIEASGRIVHEMLIADYIT